MAFIEMAFAVTAPLLLLLSWWKKFRYHTYAKALLAASCLIMIAYSVFLVNQLITMAQLAQELIKQSGMKMEAIPPFEPDAFFYRLMSMIILPWLFLIRKCRNTPWLAIVLLVVIYTGGTGSWNHYDLLFKVLQYLCLLCAVYALLWLLRELPFQRKNKRKQNLF